MDYSDFLIQGRAAQAVRPGSILDINVRESRLITEINYDFQELVSPARDVVFSFYIPPKTLKINSIKFNLYFPGFQPADYPENSSIIYFPHLYKGTPVYKNGSFDSFGQAYHQAGSGADGSNYFWYRAFQKFNISALRGFKITKAEFHWLLASIARVGSGANSEFSLKLAGIADYGVLDKGDWAATVLVSYGTVNDYDDETGNAYMVDATTFIQERVDAEDPYAAFRFIGHDEPTDVNNAINYRLNEPLLYCEMEEDAAAKVGLYVNDGPGFLPMLDSYNSNQEDIDIAAFFSGTGKKQIKFSCSKMRRIEVLLRLAIKQKGGEA